jgi:dimeric dUTPase (all-alpha-NTP-PPase superfamily)
MTLTEEQRLEIEKRADYLAQKKRLVTQRKALLEELEHAESVMEEEMIIQKRDALAVKIKDLANSIRQIEAWERYA